jgi:SAM-dependent methyltransferase
MPLPEIASMSAVRPDLWRALGARLRAIGMTADRMQEFARIGGWMTPAARLPMQRWHLRRLREPAGYALRMLTFEDPVTRDEARTALGDVPLGSLVEAGFIRRIDADRYVSPFNLNVVNRIYLICDFLTQGEDAVMGAGQMTTYLCDASRTSRRIARALDVGCGAGTAALGLASAAQRVIGTDINPRAVALSRINGALNGIANVEFREGDLFTPVAGETFDLIVSQPPFVSAPEGIEAAAFASGGRRGDEIALRLLAGIPAHLAQGGRAVVIAEWPQIEDERTEERIRAALKSDEIKLLILQCPPSNLDDYCTTYAAAAHPTLGSSFENDAILRRDHLEDIGVRGLRLTLNVIQHCSEAPTGWTAAADIPAPGQIVFTSERIDKLIAARDLVTRGARALLAARLRVPDGTRLMEEREGFNLKAASKIVAGLAPRALARQAELNADALKLLALIHNARTVGEAIEHFRPPVEVDKAMAVVRHFLLWGLLEV